MEILFDEANRISVKLEQEYARAKNAIPNREPEKPAVPTDVTAQGQEGIPKTWDRSPKVFYCTYSVKRFSMPLLA